jgi:hypothetical protein
LENLVPSGITTLSPQNTCKKPQFQLNSFSLSFFAGMVFICLGCIILFAAISVGLTTILLFFYQNNILTQYFFVYGDKLQISYFNVTQSPNSFHFVSSVTYFVQNDHDKDIYIKNGYLEIYYKTQLVQRTTSDTQYRLVEANSKTNYTFSVDVLNSKLEENLTISMLDELSKTGKIQLDFHGRLVIFYIYTGTKEMKPFTFSSALVSNQTTL